MHLTSVQSSDEITSSLLGHYQPYERCDRTMRYRGFKKTLGQVGNLVKSDNGESHKGEVSVMPVGNYARPDETLVSINGTIPYDLNKWKKELSGPPGSNRRPRDL